MTTTLTTETGYKLAYIDGRAAWYMQRRPQDERDYLTVCKSADDGGVGWEFQVVNYTEKLRTPALHVEIFDDAWAAFAEIAPVFAALAVERPQTLDAVAELLDRFGFADQTERDQPR
jgi:hypothetical protein